MTDHYDNKADVKATFGDITPETHMVNGFGITREMSVNDNGSVQYMLTVHQGPSPDDDLPNGEDPFISGHSWSVAIDPDDALKSAKALDVYWDLMKTQFDEVVHDFEDRYSFHGDSAESRADAVRKSLETYAREIVHSPVVEGQTVTLSHVHDMHDSFNVDSEIFAAREHISALQERQKYQYVPDPYENPEEIKALLGNKEPETFMVDGFGITRTIHVEDDGTVNHKLTVYQGSDPHVDDFEDGESTAIASYNWTVPINRTDASKSVEALDVYWDLMKKKFEETVADFDDYHNLKGGSVESRNEFVQQALESYAHKMIHRPLEEGQVATASNVKRMHNSAKIMHEMFAARHTLKTSKAVMIGDGLKLDDAEKVLMSLGNSVHKLETLYRESEHARRKSFENPESFVAAMGVQPLVYSHMKKVMREVDGFIGQANELWRMQTLTGGVDKEGRADLLEAMKTHMNEVSQAYFNMTNALSEDRAGLDPKEVDEIAINLGASMQKIHTLMKHETLFERTIQSGRVVKNAVD